ncbi:SulP family inorganic anion transporter, partial [Micrococcus luteus]|nr:SulP family inorganic anion transporter [Micrococcus luteus]
GVEGLLLATLMSGVFLWLMGFLRLGGLVEFIPVAVIIGFTNGIAVLIGVSQIKDFLGLPLEDVPADFFPLMQSLWQALP